MRAHFPEQRLVIEPIKTVPSKSYVIKFLENFVMNFELSENGP